MALVEQTATGQSGGDTRVATDRMRVRHGGTTYPAVPVAKGAAYEIFSGEARPGFLPDPRPGAQGSYRRFVPAVEVEVVDGQPPGSPDRPLTAPLSRGLSWPAIHGMSQAPRGETSALLRQIRCSVAISRGSRMVKVLSARQLAGHLHGWLPQGFCYREYDIAHLRTPAELGVLRSDGDDTGDERVIFALRWRAVDRQDYEIPFGTDFAGLARMPPTDRIGPPLLGTGFAPSGQHVIPEYVTAHLADLPLPAFAELLAYTRDGTEVVLYSYLPEQRTWTRMFGPQWRHLFAEVPGIPPEQEFFPIPETPTKLVGVHRSHEYEAIADPPGEFRVLAKIRAARYPVQSLARRTRYVSWRGVTCTLTRDAGEWLRLRLVRPDGEAVARLGAGCVERGIYEAWAPRAEVAGERAIDVWYDITPGTPPAG